jgi:hypothetical protein
VMSDEARVGTGLVAQVVLQREGGDRLVQQREVWSFASFEPALPGRSINASGSRVVSHQAPRGWNP